MSVLKGALYAVAVFVLFVILPHQLSLYLRERMPGLLVIEITQSVLISGLILSIVTFFLGYFPSKTVGHALAGILSVLFIVVYIYLATNGGTGIFEFTVRNTNVMVDASMIVKLIMLSVLLGSISYIVELARALKRPSAPPPRS